MFDGRRVGLVLGAGGLVGMAYHAGVLAALEHDLGWDPRRADVIVGTSAGALVGALLTLGVPASDLAAMTVGAAALDVPRVLDAALRAGPPDYPVQGLRTLLRRPRFPGWALLGSWARRPWTVRPTRALAALLPDGPHLLREALAFLGEASPGRWPEQDLRIVTVRRRDLRRVVWRAGDGGPFPDVVAASCAVPGLFAPVEIAGAPYLDGGIHSFTNADVLGHEPVDLVVVVSPMSSVGRPASGVSGLMRLHTHRVLARECSMLRVGGADVVTVEPDSDCVRVMGIDLMARDRGPAVVAAGFLGVPSHERLDAERRAAVVTRSDAAWYSVTEARPVTSSAARAASSPGTTKPGRPVVSATNMRLPAPTLGDRGSRRSAARRSPGRR
jgi:NTE family protein